MLLDKLDVQPDAQQQQQQQSLELQLVQLEQQLAKGIDSVFGRCASSAVQLQYSCVQQLQYSCSTVAVQLRTAVAVQLQYSCSVVVPDSSVWEHRCGWQAEALLN